MLITDFWFKKPHHGEAIQVDPKKIFYSRPWWLNKPLASWDFWYESGSLSHYFQGFIHPRGAGFRISSIDSITKRHQKRIGINTSLAFERCQVCLWRWRFCCRWHHLPCTSRREFLFCCFEGRDRKNRPKNVYPCFWKTMLSNKFTYFAWSSVDKKHESSWWVYLMLLCRQPSD